MFNLITPMQKVVGGRLPVPAVTDGTTVYSLLPCNPDKQGLYPNFFGYFKVTKEGSSTIQFGVNVSDSKLTIGGSRQHAGRDLTATEAEVMKILTAAAESEGHKFPEYKI